MNFNEEVPDNLGGLGNMLPADVLKKVNELLEQLHRADKDHQGSTVFIYAPGCHYVEKQFNFGKPLNPKTLPSPPCAGRENGKWTQMGPPPLCPQQVMMSGYYGVLMS